VHNTTRMYRKLALPLLVCVVTALGGCKASVPTVPDAVPVAVQILYGLPTPPLVVGSDVSLRAYVADSDFAFRDVTSQAIWSTSDSSVVQVLAGGRMQALRLGTVDVFARFEGVTGSLRVRVEPARVDYPRLFLSFGIFLTLQVGQSSSWRAQLLPTAFSAGQDVTGVATWTSSNPQVASVTQGRITGLTVGTTEINVSYNGVSHSFSYSIEPRFR
jgi:hypothetical protein